MSTSTIADLSFDLSEVFEAAEGVELTAFEEEFLADLQERHASYGGATRLTERQHAMLLRIRDKVVG